MRTIAGQIKDFDFQSISQGVNDPVLGPNVRAIFLRDWQLRIASAVQWLGQEGPPVEAINFGGNEHLGATFGVANLPNIDVDLPLPPDVVGTVVRHGELQRSHWRPGYVRLPGFTTGLPAWHMGQTSG